jgi:hypothetical protein
MFIGLSPTKLMGFFSPEVHKRNKRPKGDKKGVPIYGYKSFIIHLFLLSIFSMHFLRKSLSETCITLLCNYYRF